MKKKLIERNFTGLISGLITCVLIGIGNSMGLPLSLNGLPYQVNFILLILAVIFFWFYPPFYKKPGLFIFSVFLLQNLFLSGMDHLIYVFTEPELKHRYDEGFFLLIPVVLFLVIIWSLIFDYRKHKKPRVI